MSNSKTIIKNLVTLGLMCISISSLSGVTLAVLLLDSLAHAGSMGPLTVHATNPRYFADGDGNAVWLTGSHTWDNRQDAGTGAFDWDQYMDLLESYNHNFVKLFAMMRK